MSSVLLEGAFLLRRKKLGDLVEPRRQRQRSAHHGGGLGVPRGRDGAAQGYLVGRGGDAEHGVVEDRPAAERAPVATELDEPHSGEEVGPGKAQVPQGLHRREVAEVAGEEGDEALERTPRDGRLPGHVRRQREVEDVVASVSVTILEKIASLVGTRDSSSSSTSSGLGGGKGE